MTTIIYHVSQCEYRDGQRIRRPGRSRYAINAAQRGATETNSLLNRFRPLFAPKRESSLYGFDDIAFCGLFAKTEHIPNPFYYRIQVRWYWKGSIALIHRVHRSQNNSINARELVREYWKPTQTWQCYEYLSRSGLVLQHCSNPTEEDLLRARASYYQDSDVARGLSESAQRAAR
jgi:hypothetical protein